MGDEEARLCLEDMNANPGNKLGILTTWMNKVRFMERKRCVDLCQQAQESAEKNYGVAEGVGADIARRFIMEEA